MENATDFILSTEFPGEKNTNSAGSGRRHKGNDTSPNTSQLISDDSLDIAQQIQSVIYLAVVVVVVPLVLCNLVVFLQKGMRSATGNYVTALNFGQLVYVLTQIIFTDLWPALEETPNVHLGYCIYQRYVMIYVGVLVGLRGSNVIMCLASMERLYAVVRPLHIKTFCLSKWSVLSVVFTYLGLAVWHVFVLVRYNITIIRKRRVEFCVPLETTLYKENKELNDSFETASTVMFAYGSLVLQVILNVLTVVALRFHRLATKHVQSSANEKERRRKETQLTTTLLASTISYVALTCPAAVVTLMSRIFPEFGPRNTYSNLFLVLKMITFTLSVFACGIDFLCYLTLSSKYRKCLLGLFQCEGKGKAIPKGEPDTKTDEVSEIQTQNTS
ncbi:hypothetical protein BaRGS_00016551 [Batillaria attramentaria]|uniref:G-protein coupled receptors family 1 profile domain-containing protein n=1 Tax=Batillaria attramentaria TaxID=370345 RepID=A0ABD0KYG5_9CAEN